MARNTIHIDAPPEAAWEVLADPRLYANWVVGASATRRVEGDWPAVGSVLHHTQLIGLSDTTSVVASTPPQQIVLIARIRPLAVMKVTVEIHPEGDGTHLELQEEAVGGAAAPLPKALVDPVIKIRNRETVRRLKELAETGHQLRLDQAKGLP